MPRKTISRRVHYALPKIDVLREDGALMPTKKDQPPPDLRYFNRTQK